MSRRRVSARSHISVCQTNKGSPTGRSQKASYHLRRSAARRRAQLEVNKAAGAEFERSSEEKLAAQNLEFGPQVTIETPSGSQTRLDFMARDPMTDEIICIECKNSESVPIRSGQRRAFQEMLRDGATIVGKGKPGFPGGTKIPPTRVQIWRPSRQP